jgi:hypothetical protein
VRIIRAATSTVDVLNNLSQQLQKKHLGDGKVGIKMSGQYANVTNQRTGASFRLFEQALINSGGPFFRASQSGGLSVVVGSFPSHSREAKVLMLLHELAHLVRGKDGEWLIPNDGNKPAISYQNTRTIESHCINQLRGLLSGN